MITRALAREAATRSRRSTRTLTAALVLTLVLGSTAGCGGALANGPPPGDALDSIEAAQLFHYGNQLANSGDSIRAEQYFSAAMERGYPETEVIPRLMVVCIEASRLSAALSYAEPYLERHTDDWALRLLVASVQMGLNQSGAARGNLQTVLDQRPDEPEAHYLMAVLLRDRFLEAEGSNEHFNRYIALAPAGDHVGEARLSIAGRYIPPADPVEGETAHAEVAPEAREEEAVPVVPSGPRRIPADELEDTTDAPSGT